jgi:hypothetical protein
MPRRGNRAAARLAAHWGKALVAGSDAHTLSPLGRTYTDVPGARGKAEFLERLRQMGASAHGESGSFLKLTRTVAEIGLGLIREKPWALALAPLFLAIPVVTIANCAAEDLFARRWVRRTLPESAASRRSGVQLEVSQVKP